MTTNAQLALDLSVRSYATSASAPRDISILWTADTFLDWLEKNNPEPPPEPAAPACGVEAIRPVRAPKGLLRSQRDPRTTVYVDRTGPAMPNVTFLPVIENQENAA